MAATPKRKLSTMRGGKRTKARVFEFLRRVKNKNLASTRTRHLGKLNPVA